MGIGGRALLSFIVGVVVVAIVVLIRCGAEIEPVVSYGLTGPGFLGFVSMSVTWMLTGMFVIRR